MKTSSLALPLLRTTALLLLAAPLQLTGAPADASRPAAQGTNTLTGLEETFQRRKTTLGADNTNTLAAMRSLAAAYLAAGRWTNALPLFEDALKLTKGKLGAEHPDTLSAMHTLALANLGAGRLTEALSLSEQTLKLRQTKLGTDHPATLSSMEGLAQVHLACRQFTNAEALLRPLVERTRQVRGVNSRSLGDVLVLLGECRLRQGRFKDAESPLREALPILEKEQPGLSPAFTAQSLLGWALLGQKKFAEAEPLLVKSYEGLKQRDARRPDRSRTLVLKEAGERVVQLYEAWGKPGEAAKWRQK